MHLTLEALRALHGDCLIVHYGNPSDPRLMLIDGGPARVYGTTLKPRLQSLRDAIAALGNDNDALRLDAVVVSHLDDDHIHGLLDLTDELIVADERGQPPDCTTEMLWLNAFDDLAGDSDSLLSLVPAGQVATLSSSPGVPAGIRSAAAVVASVGQGRQLRDDAERLGWEINRGFNGLVAAPDRGGRRIQLTPDVDVFVVAPRAEQVEDLREKWDEEVRKLRDRGADEASVTAFVDKSVFNLSSIVCILEADDRRMLLTGDARGDHILEALELAGLMKDGALHLDLLKLPHHGSDRNVDTDFFQRITADHYVISGDGRHGNPETATLQMLCDARRDDDFVLHLTYHDGIDDLRGRLDQFFDAQRNAGRGFGVEFASDTDPSLRIDLLDSLPY